MEVNPFFRGRNFRNKDDFCFVLMPLHDPFTTIFEEHIKPAAKKCGLNAMKADDIYSNKVVMEDVWNSLNEARLVIADLTDSNPNVFYELGIAHTLGKQVIMIAQHITKIPFDIGHVRIINYVFPSEIDKFDLKLQETITKVLKDSTTELRILKKEPPSNLAQSNVRTQRIDSLAQWTHEWIESNLKSIFEKENVNYWYYPSYETVKEIIRQQTRTEAVKRWGLSSTTAKDYADAVLLNEEPKFKQQVEDEVKNAQQKPKPPPSPSPLRIAMLLFKEMSTPSHLPVERNAYKAALSKKDGFNDEIAEKEIRVMFREGMIYESKPGYLRLLGGL